MNSDDGKCPDVSVLVPIYNVEGYLAECLDSILQQEHVNLEVVCIDDCGTDKSIQILQEYQKRDARIRVVCHSENRGLSAARNTGIEAARGDYIVLLDSDDLLKPNALAIQVDTIRRDGADMVYFHSDLLWERFPGDPSPTVCSNPPESVLFNQELRRTNLLNYPALLHATSSWSYIYSRDFLQRHNIRYDEHLRRWEDRAFWTRAARLAESVSISPVVVREYRQRSQSITKGKQNPEHLWMMLSQLNIVLDEFELFRDAHKGSDTRIHTKYLHSYVAFRVTSWFLNAVNRLKDAETQIALLQGAVDLFTRMDWSNVDLHCVKNFTRRLEIDIGRTALLSGLLRKGMVQQVQAFFDVPRLPVQDLAAAEEAFEGRYRIKRKRFAKQESGTPVSVNRGDDEIHPEEWMKDVSVVIHIGFRKTGTTYIQRAFDLNRDLLLADGVLFPNTGLDRTDGRGGRPGALAGHLGILSLVRNNRKNWGLWQNILNEFGTNDVKAIFISAENFLHEYQRVDLQRLQATFSGFKRLSFIVSLRRPDEWIESLYKELVCGGWRGEARDFATFVNENWEQMDFARRLAPWFQQFGIEAFDAIAVHTENDEADGVMAVLSYLKERTGAGPAPSTVLNWERPVAEETYASPKAELIEAIRLLNAAKKPSAAYRREVAWLIRKWNDANELNDLSLMDSITRDRIGEEVIPKYYSLLDQFGINVPHEIRASGQLERSADNTDSESRKIDSALMQDVISALHKLPNKDPVDHFFRRFHNKGMPKASKTIEMIPPSISGKERMVAILLLRPVLAVWNRASRDRREILRRHAKKLFGDINVDRIVNLARRANPGR